MKVSLQSLFLANLVVLFSGSQVFSQQKAPDRKLGSSRETKKTSPPAPMPVPKPAPAFAPKPIPAQPKPAPAAQPAPAPKPLPAAKARIESKVSPQPRTTQTPVIATPTVKRAPVVAPAPPVSSVSFPQKEILPKVAAIPVRETAKEETPAIETLSIPSARKTPPPILRWKEEEAHGSTIKPSKVSAPSFARFYDERFQNQLPQPWIRPAQSPANPHSQTFSGSQHNGSYWSIWIEPKKSLCVPKPYWIRSCTFLPTIFWTPVYYLSYIEFDPYLFSPTFFEEDVVVAQEAAPLDLNDAEKAVRRGHLYFRAGHFDKAAAAYLEAVALAPDQAELYFLASDALFAIGDYHFAAYSIRKALELDPGLAYGERDKTELYFDRDFFYRHLRLLERYLEEHPEDVDAELVLGYNRYFSGDLMGARRAFRRILEMQTDPAAVAMLDALTQR